MGVVSQRTEVEQPEHMGPGFSSKPPVRMSNSRRCRAGLATPVTDKNRRLPGVQVWAWWNRIIRSSGKGFKGRIAVVTVVAQKSYLCKCFLLCKELLK